MFLFVTTLTVLLNGIFKATAACRSVYVMKWSICRKILTENSTEMESAQGLAPPTKL